MLGRRIALLRQVLLFVLVTLLGIATGYLTNERRPPVALRMLERSALPLAIVIAVVIVAVMIWHQLADERGSPAAVWDSARPPFPGLEAFTEQDAGVFFGRAAEATELLERLHPVEPVKAHRLIAVIGPSGVGKSSLVSAGLLPRLAQRRQRWIVVPPFVPEDRPTQGLARSLAEAAREPSADRLTAILTAGPHALADCVQEVRAGSGGRSSPVLVTIDQGEELLTLTGDQERGQFLGLLEDGLAADQRLWIVVIMRSEFLTAFLATPHARLFRDPVTVGALGRDALYDVITGPAAKAGLRFDPQELTQLMVDDAGGGDALPLLAYTLQELYLAAGKSMVVTAADYRRLNGVTGALTRQADKVTAELDAGDAGDAGSPVLATLLKFVAFGENGPTCRRVRRGLLNPAGRRVADAFVSARLLVTSAGPDDGDAVIEVAHEALFRHWAPLRQEIEAHAEELQWRADLERWALDWERSGRQDAYLLRASPPAPTTPPSGSGTPIQGRSCWSCAATAIPWGRWPGRRTGRASPPRPATGRSGSGTAGADGSLPEQMTGPPWCGTAATAPSWPSWRATMAGFSVLHGHPEETRSPPPRPTAPSGSGTRVTAPSFLLPVCRQTAPKGSPGHPTEPNSPRLHATGQCESGTRPSASRHSSSRHTARCCGH